MNKANAKWSLLTKEKARHENVRLKRLMERHRRLAVSKFREEHFLRLLNGPV